MNDPHGGKLINKVVKKDNIDFDNIDLEVIVDEEQLSEISNISNGLYSPLTGYMNQDDFESVVEKMQLSNGVPWAIPIFLPVDMKNSKKVKIGSQVSFKLANGKPFAIMVVEDKYTFDKEKYCINVFGTNNLDHPGVKRISDMSDIVIGGGIFTYGKLPTRYGGYEQSPVQTRKVFEDKGWNTIVAFQTRNPAHRAHEFIQKICLEFVDGLFINPIIGKKKSGDFKDEVILAVYDMMAKTFFPASTTHFAVYPSRMNYAGPREAVFHAIVRKNFGCTHFIVGRDHAGVGDYYDKLAAHKIFDNIENLGMKIMKVSAAFYDKKQMSFVTEKTSVTKNADILKISGSEIRRLIKKKDYKSLKYFMRPEVLDIIFSFPEPFVK